MAIASTSEALRSATIRTLGEAPSKWDEGGLKWDEAFSAVVSHI